MNIKSFQEIFLTLQNFWKNQGCLIFTPYNSEVGAGTFNPATFFKVLDEKPWRVCYIEPSKRPRDGRYSKNPLRVQQYWQLQVLLKPAPKNIQEIYLKSLTTIGIDLKNNDIKFIEDDWESPTLGAWGIGWQVELNGIEITQFTYFQQMGGLDLKIIPVEITYGLERIAMFLQKVFSIFEIQWRQNDTWGDIYFQNEKEFSHFNFEEIIPEEYVKLFNFYEKEAQRLLAKGLVYPGYDFVIKCSHIFNLLEARGVISVSERINYIKRIRDLARLAAIKYLEKNQSLSSF